MGDLRGFGLGRVREQVLDSPHHVFIRAVFAVERLEHLRQGGRDVLLGELELFLWLQAVEKRKDVRQMVRQLGRL